MFGIGIQELLIVLVIVLLLFGGKQLPELSKSIGEAIRELRKGFTGEDSMEPSRLSDKKKPAKH